ncbi:MAG: uroporphyrinogen-III C-methyltransferase [Pseudomonadota bacterium]
MSIQDSDQGRPGGDDTAFLLRPSTASRERPGKVYLVGGGPGDPELLTVRGARLIGCADALVYDHLVGKGILELARADAAMHYVGKEAGAHTLPQEDINLLLVRLAQRGLQVVRLKGGDPFIFGRGGEEIEELVKHHIPFEVVPGVTAASGMSAYAGIPLTHRDFAQSCIFTTGHLKDGSCNLDWPVLARPNQTVVIYMGVGGLGEISRKLQEHGMDAHTPAAVVQYATLPQQRTVVGSIASLPALAQAQGIRPPALIVIGQVVRLHRQLAWFRPREVASQEI